MRDKAFNIATNPRYDGYQRGPVSMIYEFSDKKSTSLADKSASSSGIENENTSNKELAERIMQTSY